MTLIKVYLVHDGLKTAFRLCKPFDKALSLPSLNSNAPVVFERIRTFLLLEDCLLEVTWKCFVGR